MKSLQTATCSGKMRARKSTLPSFLRPLLLRLPPLFSLMAILIIVEFHTQIIFAAPELITDRIGISENSTFSTEFSNFRHEFDKMMDVADALKFNGATCSRTFDRLRCFTDPFIPRLDHFRKIEGDKFNSAIIEPFFTESSGIAGNLETFSSGINPAIHVGLWHTAFKPFRRFYNISSARPKFLILPIGAAIKNLFAGQRADNTFVPDHINGERHSGFINHVFTMAFPNLIVKHTFQT